MATAAKRALCSTCGKKNWQVTCKGCSKIFCINDFNRHRQELGIELDEVEVARDVFRQTLTDKIGEPQNHILIEQINEWENESIGKIRQAAEEARQILFKHTIEFNTKLENKLTKLTDELRQSREKNEFSELDLGEWRKELTQMKDELTKPSSVTIRQDATPLVTKINVDISDDDTYETAQHSGRSHQSNDSDGNVLIPCEWCNKGIPLGLYENHIETCREEEHKQLQQNARRTSQNTVPVTDVDASTYHVIKCSSCKFCGIYDPVNDLNYHQLNCVENPRHYAPHNNN